MVETPLTGVSLGCSWMVTISSLTQQLQAFYPNLTFLQSHIGLAMFLTTA